MMNSNDDEKSIGSRSQSRESIRPPPLTRSKVGRYEVIYPLDHGGMASVHVGRLSGMAGFERLVAIKVIHPHMASEKSFVKMFLDEARLAARIHHPNVGEIVEVGDDDGLLYMVGELIMGKNLRSLFRKAMQAKVTISNAMIADIGSGICLGLHEAHELTGANGEKLNLVHRDVSPRNIVISYNGFVKLIDFGVAYARERLSSTETTSIKGKISFMPPEQIRGEPLDRRSDIFSLGVVLYLMVTGVRPFEGSNDAERMNKILNSDFVKPSKHNPRLNPKMEQIILTAMASNREDRYASAAVMGEDLQTYARMSGAAIGAPARSKLMHDLFQDEIAKHEQQLQAYREQQAASNESVLMPATLSSGDSQVSAASAGSVSPHRTSRIGPIPLNRKTIGAALGATIGLMVAVGLILSFGNEKKPDPKTDRSPVVSAPIDTAAETKPLIQNDENKSITASESDKTVEIALDIRPETAVVTIDDRPLELGTKQFSLRANRQLHTLVISAKGYISQKRTVIADSDKELIVSLQALRPMETKTKTPKPNKTTPGFKKSPYDRE